jgi:hypothetical protein
MNDTNDSKNGDFVTDEVKAPPPPALAMTTRKLTPEQEDEMTRHKRAMALAAETPVIEWRFRTDNGDEVVDQPLMSPTLRDMVHRLCKLIIADSHPDLHEIHITHLGTVGDDRHISAGRGYHTAKPPMAIDIATIGPLDAAEDPGDRALLADYWMSLGGHVAHEDDMKVNHLHCQTGPGTYPKSWPEGY